MNKYIYYIVAFILVLGCRQKEDPETPPVPDTFSIDCKSKDISYKGGVFEVNVTSFKKWEVETDRGWINTDISAGEGSAKVEVTIEASSEKTERSGAVYFIQDIDTLKVDIHQELAPFIELATEAVQVDGDGDTFDILFLANTAVEISYSHDWIRPIQVSSSNVLSFEVLRNMADAREAYITLSASTDKDIYKILTIRQGEKVPHPSMAFEEGTELKITGEIDFKLNPIFEDMTDFTLIWSSSDPSIATVDGTGRVSVHKPGSCTITAKNTFHEVSASISLKIRFRAESISVMFGNQDMTEVPVSSRFVGEMIPVVVTLIPDNSYSEDFLLLSSNSEVADFDDNILFCKKPGKTEIYIESAFNDIHFQFTVLVIETEN